MKQKDYKITYCHIKDRTDRHTATMFACYSADDALEQFANAVDHEESLVSPKDIKRNWDWINVYPVIPKSYRHPAHLG